jgi:hypothetical protein
MRHAGSRLNDSTVYLSGVIVVVKQYHSMRLMILPWSSTLTIPLFFHFHDVYSEAHPLDHDLCIASQSHSPIPTLERFLTMIYSIVHQ